MDLDLFLLISFDYLSLLFRGGSINLMIQDLFSFYHISLDIDKINSQAIPYFKSEMRESFTLCNKYWWKVISMLQKATAEPWFLLIHATLNTYTSRLVWTDTLSQHQMELLISPLKHQKWRLEFKLGEGCQEVSLVVGQYENIRLLLSV